MKLPFRLILTGLIPMFFFVAAVIHIKADTSPEVVLVKGGKIKGFENGPDTYQVTASPAKVFHETKNRTLLIIGFCVACIVPVLYSWYWTNVKKEVPNFMVIGLCWIIGSACIFGMYIRQDPFRFSTNISAREYQAKKDSLDKLFPIEKKP